MDPQSFSEADRTITFTITRSDDSEDASVWFSTVQDAGFDNIGDYVGIEDREVFFAAGDSVETVTLRINEDNAPEADETFGGIVQLSRFDSLTTYEDRTTFTILNDDVATNTPPDLFGAASQSFVPGTRLTLEELFTISDADGDLSRLTLVDSSSESGGAWLFNGTSLDLNTLPVAPSFDSSEFGSLEYLVGNGLDTLAISVEDLKGSIVQRNFTISGSIDGALLTTNELLFLDVLRDPNSTLPAVLQAAVDAGLFSVETFNKTQNFSQFADIDLTERAFTLYSKELDEFAKIKLEMASLVSKAPNLPIEQYIGTKFSSYAKLAGPFASGIEMGAELASGDFGEALDTAAAIAFGRATQVVATTILATGAVALISPT